MFSGAVNYLYVRRVAPTFLTYFSRISAELISGIEADAGLLVNAHLSSFLKKVGSLYQTLFFYQIRTTTVETRRCRVFGTYKKTPQRGVSPYFCLSLFNNQIPFHTEFAVFAYGAVVFKSAGFVSNKFNSISCACVNLLGAGVEFINHPVVETVIILEYNFDGITLLNFDFVHGKSKIGSTDSKCFCCWFWYSSVLRLFR